MEMICDEERCSLRHGACFACFLIVCVFIIQIYAFNNSLMGHIKGKCVRYFWFKKKKTQKKICWKCFDFLTKCFISVNKEETETADEDKGHYNDPKRKIKMCLDVFCFNLISVFFFLSFNYPYLQVWELIQNTSYNWLYSFWNSGVTIDGKIIWTGQNKIIWISRDICESSSERLKDRSHVDGIWSKLYGWQMKVWAILSIWKAPERGRKCTSEQWLPA